MSVVEPQYGPSLPELVATLGRGWRAVIVAGLALLVAAGALLALRSRPDETQIVVRGPATFNFVHGSELAPVSRPGTLAALRRDRNGLFLDSFVVRPLDLAPYRGAVGGTLPIYAVAYLQKLRRRYGPLDVALEGRTRINNGIGYQLVLRAKRGPRTLYVRHVLLVPDDPEGARHGVILELESTPGAGTPNTLGTGNAGPLKLAMRSFRFGTSREGGTK